MSPIWHTASISDTHHHEVCLLEWHGRGRRHVEGHERHGALALHGHRHPRMHACRHARARGGGARCGGGREEGGVARHVGMQGGCGSGCMRGGRRCLRLCVRVWVGKPLLLHGAHYLWQEGGASVLCGSPAARTLVPAQATRGAAPAAAAPPLLQAWSRHPAASGGPGGGNTCGVVQRAA